MNRSKMNRYSIGIRYVKIWIALAVAHAPLPIAMMDEIILHCKELKKKLEMDNKNG